ncbi:hypothetical protein M7I_0672 [Glarea lozoyensis 74030]|uniref:Uncharacterized protein n=1 Tax=Glarea lozoyensis (strain ATCC 74030 / MF5533) TaxID=1104152 RepID=H0EE04_GLAL7|nr:hypothetical protein M7I_0672 [Glarea lozoyensis 74030]
MVFNLPQFHLVQALKSLLHRKLPRRHPRCLASFQKTNLLKLLHAEIKQPLRRRNNSLTMEASNDLSYNICLKRFLILYSH